MAHTHHQFFATAARLLGAVFVPFVVVSLFLVSSRWPSYRPTPAVDWLGLVAATVIGAVAIWTLPLQARTRVISVAIYVPLCGVILFVYCIWFVGMFFGEFL